MKKISVSRKVNGELKKVWRLFSEFDLVHKFHPMVKTSPLYGDVDAGTGTQRICSMYNGMKAKEEITSYKEFEHIKIDIVESPMPFSKAYGDFYFKSIDNDTTEVSIDMFLEPKFGMLGGLLYKLIMRQKLISMLNAVLKGLDDYLKSGRLIGKNGVLMEEDPDFEIFAKHSRVA